MLENLKTFEPHHPWTFPIAKASSHMSFGFLLTSRPDFEEFQNDLYYLKRKYRDEFFLSLPDQRQIYPISGDLEFQNTATTELPKLISCEYSTLAPPAQTRRPTPIPSIHKKKPWQPSIPSNYFSQLSSQTPKLPISNLITKSPLNPFGKPPIDPTDLDCKIFWEQTFASFFFGYLA